MACRSCGSRSRRGGGRRIDDRNRTKPTDKQILVIYNPECKAQVRVVGLRTRTDYGLVSGGSQITVYKSDADARPDLFKPVKQRLLKRMPEVFSIG